jgi:outer membrane protein TolC
MRRLADYVAGGNLELSLRAYLELVLENNPDLAVARLSVEQPRNAITRAMAAFDPAFSASFSSQHSTTTSASSLDGTPTVTQLNQPFAGSYTQLLSTGTNLSVQFSATRYSNNLVYSTYNPELSASFGAQFDHPLLRNRGAVLTKLSVLSARSSLRIGEEQMRWQVMGLIANAENVYWAVVGARESLALANRFLELQAASLDRFKKQVDAAALLPLELYQPESEYAQVQAMVIQAKSALAKQENALRQQIGADLDPAVRDLPIVLTEPLEAAVIGRPDREEAVAVAIKARPDYLAAVQTLDVDDLGIRQTTEMLKPSVSFTGAYFTTGLGGIFVPANSPGGLGDALNQMFNFVSPQYSLGVKLSLPVRDHSAAANLADAQVQKKRDALAVRKAQQTLRLQVSNAIEDLAAASASLEQAKLAKDYADKRLAAEQKKYELGIELPYFVLAAQTDLNTAEGAVLQQSINYRLNLINFYQVTGQLLDQRGITVK